MYRQCVDTLTRNQRKLCVFMLTHLQRHLSIHHCISECCHLFPSHLFVHGEEGWGGGGSEGKDATISSTMVILCISIATGNNIYILLNLYVASDIIPGN